MSRWLGDRRGRQAAAAERDPGSGWSRFAGAGIEIHEVPGGHFTLVREPHVRALAVQLSRILATQETVP